MTLRSLVAVNGVEQRLCEPRIVGEVVAQVLGRQVFAVFRRRLAIEPRSHSRSLRSPKAITLLQVACTLQVFLQRIGHPVATVRISTFSVS